MMQCSMMMQRRSTKLLFKQAKRPWRRLYQGGEKKKEQNEWGFKSSKGRTEHQEAWKIAPADYLTEVIILQVTTEV
jgi:hypothetical protein